MSMGGSIFDSICRCICNTLAITAFIIFSVFVTRGWREEKGLKDCYVLDADKATGEFE